MARVNLTIRQPVAAVGRRVITLGTGEAGVRPQLAVYPVYDNFCVPPPALRRPLLQPDPTHGTGAAPGWYPCTPAMAAGLTAPVWTRREGLLGRVPPWHQPQEGEVGAERDARGVDRTGDAHKQGKRAPEGLGTPRCTPLPLSFPRRGRLATGPSPLSVADRYTT
jgi:hypothetical protein